MLRIIILIAFLSGLAACATPVTILEKNGYLVRCGGGTAGSWSGGLIGYTIQEQNDHQCVLDYAGSGYKVITPKF